jgi:hypothetical protein
LKGHHQVYRVYVEGNDTIEQEKQQQYRSKR